MGAPFRENKPKFWAHETFLPKKKGKLRYNIIYVRRDREKEIADAARIIPDSRFFGNVGPQRYI